MRKYLFVAALLIGASDSHAQVRLEGFPDDYQRAITEQAVAERTQTIQRNRRRHANAVNRRIQADAQYQAILQAERNAQIAAGLAFGPPCGCGNNTYHKCKALRGKHTNPTTHNKHSSHQGPSVHTSH